MTALPLDRTTRLRLPALTLGRYRGVLVLELSPRDALRRTHVTTSAKVDGHDQRRDVLLGLRQGAGV
ncbi:MAG TPA: hypothetical protein VN257_02080 [Actinotalea sp.]|nr:hypothetical protein [Actinotalea sp.]